MKKVSQILLIMLISIGCLFAQAPTGSKSMLHVQTARTFESGRFEIHSDLNFFTKLTEDINNLNPGNFEAQNYWLVNSGIALTYGINDNFDIIVAPGLYQDTHNANNEFNLPDDIRLFVKAGSFDFAERHMYYAFQFGLRFPVGEDHNYPFTYYASPAVEYGIGSALSFYSDPYLPERSLSLHLNVGWWNHNEAGEEVTKGKPNASVNSSELLYGFGILFPTELFDFQLELTGSSFIEQPDVFVFSREDWMYITPSIKYKPLSWLDLIFGVDIRLSTDKDESVGISNYLDRGLPNYTDWKAHLGLELTLLPLGTSTQSAAQVDREQFNKRVEFFQQIIEDRERSENIKEELDKLKEERETAEKELEELKQILEEEGN